MFSLNHYKYICWALLLIIANTLPAQDMGSEGKPAYKPAPLHAVKPKGWLLQQLQIMQKGSSGHLDEIYDKIKDDNGWLGGKGDGWEETPYWLDGAVTLAYLLDDKKLQDKVLRYIHWTLDHQRPSGYFGPITQEERNNKASVTTDNPQAGEDWWPKMVMLKVLQQYYSATGDQRVITFMDRYFRYQLKVINKCPVGKWSAWSEARGVDNIMMVNWLYGLTGEKYLVELAELLSKQSFPWSKWFEERDLFMQAAAQQNGDKVMQRHSVNVAMGLKDPVIHYLSSNDRKYLNIQKTAFHDLMLLHGLPMGIFSGDEDLHGNDLSQGSELCTVVETMYSLEKILEITGDAHYMDALERIAFNALPAQTSDDYKMKQYFQIPNQVQISRGAFEFSVTQSNGFQNVMGSKSGYTCCYANMHQGWTKFTAQLWHHCGENGIASLTYAPSEFHTKLGEAEISIREITAYPFEDKITFRLSTSKEVSFPWRLRIPSWCKMATVILNGKTLRTEKGGQIITLNRTRENNDELIVQLPMEVTTSNWAKNSRAVERGPLVYALKIGEEWKKEHHEEAGDYYCAYPTTAWNYGLVQSAIANTSEFKVSVHAMPENFVWNQTNAPVDITAPAKKLPTWKLTDEILYTPSSDRSGLYQGAVSDVREQIVLIPYGCTKLRIVGFPVVKE